VSKADLESIRESTNKARVLGSDKFKENIERLADRRVRPKPRGVLERRWRLGGRDIESEDIKVFFQVTAGSTFVCEKSLPLNNKGSPSQIAKA